MLNNGLSPKKLSVNAKGLTINTEYPIIYVTDYGADPTATKDSTHAFQQAVDAALTHGKQNTSLANGKT